MQSLVVDLALSRHGVYPSGDARAGYLAGLVDGMRLVAKELGIDTDVNNVMQLLERLEEEMMDGDYGNDTDRGRQDSHQLPTRG